MIEERRRLFIYYEKARIFSGIRAVGVVVKMELGLPDLDVGDVV